MFENKSSAALAKDVKTAKPVDFNIFRSFNTFLCITAVLNLNIHTSYF